MNDKGQASFTTVCTAFEACATGDEIDVASCRADDFLLQVLEKFQWLLKFQLEKAAGDKTEKASYGKAA